MIDGRVSRGRGEKEYAHLAQARDFLGLAALDHYTDLGPFGWHACLNKVPQEPALLLHLCDRLPDAGVFMPVLSFPLEFFSQVFFFSSLNSSVVMHIPHTSICHKEQLLH